MRYRQQVGRLELRKCGGVLRTGDWGSRSRPALHVGATDDVNSLSCVMRDPESKIAEVIPGVRGPDGKAHIGFEGDDRSCRENPVRVANILGAHRLPTYCACRAASLGRARPSTANRNVPALEPLRRHALGRCFPRHRATVDPNRTRRGSRSLRFHTLRTRRRT